jgi:glycine cleavage system transcriptional repressor
VFSTNCLRPKQFSEQSSQDYLGEEELKKYMILFLVGKDRPGIVDEVSTLFFEHGANIEDSRMATMGGRFSIMTLFSCHPGQLAAIKKSVKGLAAKGFETSLHHAEDPADFPCRAEMPFRIEVNAMDHPGIVQKIVHILHNYGANIQSLDTQVTRAPLSGTPMFDLNLEAGMPEERSFTQMKEELNALASGMNLDLTFKKSH